MTGTLHIVPNVWNLSQNLLFPCVHGCRHANVAKIVSAVEPEIQGTLRAAKDDVLSLLESSLKLSTTPVWRSRVGSSCIY